VAPDELVAPYDETLTDKGRRDRRVWADLVLVQLGRYDYEVHAGAAYADYGLRSGLISAGAQVTMPTEGLRQGEQLAFYRNQRQH
jgi:hypothetical protein